MPTARWKGTTDVKEQANSRLFETSKEGPRYTLIYKGPYTAIMGNLPARLSNISGVASTYFVDTVRVEKGPGGTGTMTVTMTPAPIQDYTFDTNAVFEVEWIEVQKKLETHPRYLDGGAKALNDADLDAIEEWKNAASASLRTAAYAKLTSNSGVSGNATDFVDKLKHGTDSFVIYSPLCRVTTKHASKPDVSECGLRNDPPSGCKVNGYIYLKTADRATRDRTWTRVQEWTGATLWDTDLYADS